MNYEVTYVFHFSFDKIRNVFLKCGEIFFLLLKCMC